MPLELIYHLFVPNIGVGIVHRLIFLMFPITELVKWIGSPRDIIIWLISTCSCSFKSATNLGMVLIKVGRDSSDAKYNA